MVGCPSPSLFRRAGQASKFLVPFVGFCMLAIPVLCWGASSDKAHDWRSVGPAQIDVRLAKAHVSTGELPHSSSPTGHNQIRRTSARKLAPSLPATPVEVKELEIIAQDAAKLGDPELGKAYQEVNERHFDNKLPAIPVLWESRLAEIGGLAAEGFTQKGLWATFGGRSFILLNPLFSQDAAETKRVLCHEVVHEYLYNIGSKETNHGPQFQAALRRLFETGAFEGIPATDAEKSSLRSWVDAESARLKEEAEWIEKEKHDLDVAKDAIDREALTLNREVDELNRRIASAREQGYGFPFAGEVELSKAKSCAYDQRVADLQGRMIRHNAAVEAHDAAVAQFDEAVNRYHSMMAYPDGLDEEAVLHAKTRGSQASDRAASYRQPSSVQR